MKKPLIADILELSVPERIQLVEEIWDSIAAIPDSLELSDSQRLELDSRLAEYRKDPSVAIPWEEVKARIGL